MNEKLEPFTGDGRILKTEMVLEPAQHLTEVAIVGRLPDGDLYVAGTHSGEKTAGLFEEALIFLDENIVEVELP